MADFRDNQHRFLDAQHDNISELFQSAESDTDWDTLSQMVDEALANPFLPRYYRGKYEAIRAWTADDPTESIRRARDAIEDMRLVLEAEDRDEAYINDRLSPLHAMLEAVEEAMNAEDDDEDVPESQEPARPGSPAEPTDMEGTAPKSVEG